MENKKFKELYDKYAIPNSSSPRHKQMWICKPGENANRGKGIKVLPSLDHVSNFLAKCRPNERWVVQKYIHSPLLVGGTHWLNSPMRKFDIRMFGLAQIIEGSHFRGYFYKEGYVRTSSYKYDTKDLSDSEIHLTNDAIQQKCDDYEKYEPGNKISFKDFATYLKNYRKVDFDEVILPQMKEIVSNTLEAFWVRIQ